jgi:hypothetical protein
MLGRKVLIILEELQRYPHKAHKEKREQKADQPEDRSSVENLETPFFALLKH